MTPALQKHIFCFLSPHELSRTCVYVSKKTSNQIQDIFNQLFSILEKKFPVVSSSLQERKWSKPRIVGYIFNYLSRKRPIQHLIETASAPYDFNEEINFWSFALHSIKEFRQLHSIDIISLVKIWPNDEQKHRELADFFFFHGSLLKSREKLSKSNKKKVVNSTIFDIEILDLDKKTSPMFKLSEEIIQFDKLETVFLRNNSFTTFPITLCYLPRLRYLHLDHCGLNEIPEGIVLLNLTTLCLANNELSSLPLSLQKSFSLKILDISNNCLTSKEIKKTLLYENEILAFQGLELLFLSNNKMTQEEQTLLIDNIHSKKDSLQIT